MQSSESTEPIVNSETSVHVEITDSLTSGASTLAQLNTLIEESMQIYELEDQKTNIIEDLHNALKIITEFLDSSPVQDAGPPQTVTFLHHCGRN